MFLVQSVVTCGALFWLLHRAWLTLLTPVPELISILGVEVPDAPEVSLAGIKADAVTLHWTRPGANKPVIKYLIQVNGVNVGESSRMETAITVTGLKPGHFYNVRVIAVGSNNFQAGSRVIRLRTYGRDGRPQLDNGRVPSHLSAEEQQSAALIDSSDDAPAVRLHGAGVEAASEGPQSMARESSGTHIGQRRNTVGRKHSPSIAAADQGTTTSKHPEETMHQLTEKFEAIRRETEEVMGQVARDSETFRLQMLDLVKERDEKKQALNEKEEATEKLKKEVNYSERANRQAQNRKSQKEKTLRDLQTEREKMSADILRWRKEIEKMEIEREEWQKEKEELLGQKVVRVQGLRAVIQGQQKSVETLDRDMRVKRLRMKELEEERKSLPGAEDSDASRERDEADERADQGWLEREQDLLQQLNNQQSTLRHLQAQYHGAQVSYNALNSRLVSNPLMYHGNSSGVDFDPNSQGKAKSRRSRNRKSRTGTMSSPTGAYATTDSPYPSVNAYNNLMNTTSPSFAPGPYIDHSNGTAMVPLHMSGLSEVEFRAMTAGAPLSPTATSLLPSNIFSDDDPPSPRAAPAHAFGPALYGNIGEPFYDIEGPSPTSSSRSASLVSSPRASSHSLAKYGVSSHDHALENGRGPLKSPRTKFGAIGFPNPSDPASTNKFTTIFGFSKSRAKTNPVDSPALGSLKSGQSQSFPRSTDEPEVMGSRNRRVSFTSSWNVPSLFSRNTAVSDATEGNGPAPARNPTARRRRGLHMFGSSVDDPATFSERDPSSPRPVSIASSDLPRPSTESAPFGWPAAEGNAVNRNSPLATNWSVHAHAPQPWSRNPSRRPSIQYGSTNALTSGIASDEDEFLPPDTLISQSSPPVGVIGTRPVSSHKPVTPKLNPAAPTFKAMLGFPSKNNDKEKGKGKERAGNIYLSQADNQGSAVTSSPPSRQSRDAHSVHTQNSVAESSESLDKISSNTPSEMNPPGTSTKESSFQRLLRKGSSSKFSLSSIRGKDAGLFGTKKGGSTTYSERDGSIDLVDTPLGKSIDSVTSSPMIGSIGSGDWGRKDKELGAPKEGRIGNWGRALGIKKQKNKESLDVDRSEAETTGTEDEGA